MNIEAVQPPDGCDPGLVIQLCDKHYKYKKYLLGYQWKHVRGVIGEQVISQLHDYNITLGKVYGGTGIDIRVLISSEPDDSYYEISARQLCMLNLSPSKLTKLITLHKLIIYDYAEAGFYIKVFIEQYREHLHLARSITYFHMVSTACKGDWQVELPAGHNEITVPTMLYGVGTYYQREPLKKLPAYHQKEILVPVHKARHWRLDALAVLDKKGILDKADWSLYKIEKDALTGYGSFRSSPALFNIMHDSLSATCNVSEFVKKYEFPRMLPQDTAELFHEHMDLNAQWQNYSRYVSIETHCDKWVISEKSLKGFVLGVPTVTVSAKNFNSYLSSYGFEIDGNYDSGDTLVERASCAADFMLSSKGNKEIALHNQMLLRDNNFLSSLIVNSFLKIE